MTRSQDALSSTALEGRWPRPVDQLVTVVVPVTGAPDDMTDYYREYSAPFKESNRPFEFVFVASPSCADAVRALEPLVVAGEPIRALVVQTVSDATLMRVGASLARGTTVINLPAFRRVEAPALLEMVQCIDDGADFVVARRWPRLDPWVNRLQTWVFHQITRTLRGERLHDVASGVHAMRQDAIGELPLYGDLFRFLPILAIGAGLSVKEVDARQHADDRHVRLHGLGVYVRRLVDIIGLFFIVRFREKPLRFFGLLGATGLFAGSGILLVLFVERMFGRAVADRPMMVLGVLLLVLGVQALGLGLVGEIIVHLHIGRSRRYRTLEGPPVERVAATARVVASAENATSRAATS